jgi:hypothetical protein
MPEREVVLSSALYICDGSPILHSPHAANCVHRTVENTGKYQNHT